ncbi:hypothetical protein SAMN05444972_1011 [Marininema halotolerans]|uniref:Uncharacterized protein n=1 Tax=Marininema halotolerans TaxID=1155944 RepID=A0A1I6NQ47_9BACL|nr:hypothetical protein SAMN05444972_1011 [Marininema halotolerans]
MFGKVASDVLGLSDVGTVIKPQDFDKVDSDDYILHEDGEKNYLNCAENTPNFYKWGTNRRVRRGRGVYPLS